MTDLGRTQHLHDRDDLMAEQVRNGMSCDVSGGKRW